MTYRLNLTKHIPTTRATNLKYSCFFNTTISFFFFLIFFNFETEFHVAGLAPTPYFLITKNTLIPFPALTHPHRDFLENNYKTQTISLVRKRLKLIWFLAIRVQRGRFLCFLFYYFASG